jgi:hypothetical protein
LRSGLARPKKYNEQQLILRSKIPNDTPISSTLTFDDNALLPVLFERTGKKEGQLQGRTPFYQAINVPANDRLMGEFVDVKITEATANALVGEVVTIC